MKPPTTDPGSEPVSKSERKRQAAALFELGRQLVAMPAAKLARLPLPDPVRAAVEEARAIRSRIARKRQLQYLAKLLRAVDAEPIEQALAAAGTEGRAELARQHRIEHWRDRLLADGDRALAGLLARDPGIERQRLRQLVRQAVMQQRQGQPPRAARELFRVLRAIELERGLPEPS